MLKTAAKKRFKKSESGMAIFETIPVLFMLVLVFNFSLGFFGAVQSGLLNSIGAYNYAIETFRFRSNLMYFRPGITQTIPNYSLSRNRVHGVVQEASENTTTEIKGQWPATMRAITFNYVKGDAQKGLALIDGSGESDHINFGQKGNNNNIWTADSNYTPQTGDAIQTARIWVKTVYGICVTADCTASP